jgi:hypothetical protein
MAAAKTWATGDPDTGEHGQVTGSHRLHQSARPRLLQPANEHNPRPGSSSGQLPPSVRPTLRLVHILIGIELTFAQAAMRAGDFLV